MKRQLTRLFGGHRNDVYKTDGVVKIIWKDGFKRRKQIREGVLLENFIAAHTDIKARLLVDKSKPIQEEDGKLVTYFHYTEGEIRYPWNLAEIASAAKLMGKFHWYLKARPSAGRPGLITQLHLDFARGNILFRPKTSDAVGVIDFETAAPGPVEQELGRTLSFILVDAQINSVFSIQYSVFKRRLDAFLTNYPLTFRKDKVINWTLRYLTGEDYGNLNYIRDKAISWLHDCVVNNLTI